MGRTRKSDRERGVSLFLGTLSLVMLVPIVGMVIDCGILYSVKSRLQAAVDGAALAAARALNDGLTLSAQTTAAQQNAVNWFYANFPTGNWSTTNTVMTTANVTVSSPANVRTVAINNVTTTVPTWFMRYLGIASTTVAATGSASRRDVVAMMVLDRSGSMCTPGSASTCGEGDGTSCADMITAAKIFTGQFAETRDHIGMLTFADGTYLDSAPVTDFQSVLGYSNNNGSGSGLIDNIQCNGGTNTSAAISLGYNEVYKMNLPGALNVVMLETDGLPNGFTWNTWNSSTSTTNLASGSTCQDTNNKTPSGGGWKTLATMRNWTTGYNMNVGGTGYLSNIPSGAIGALITADPDQGPPYWFHILRDPWQTTDSTGSNSIAVTGTENGCAFNSALTTTYSDLGSMPPTDIYGNAANPSTNPYQSVTMASGNVKVTGTIATDWTNVHNAAINLADNSAYNVRTNATLPAYVFVIGLAGNAGTPPDPVLLQRMANDPNGDLYNGNNPSTGQPYYLPCSQETTSGSTCVQYPSQPQGTFIFSPTAANLGLAYLSISSQILRLSH